MKRQQDVVPLTALLAALASAARAARRAGRRTRGRVRRRERAWVYPRRPADYVAAGIVVGSTGAFAVVALGRAARGGPGGGPGRSLAGMRTAALRAVRQRPRVQAEHGDGSAGGAEVPVSTSAPTMSVVADTSGRGARHASGAA